MRHRQQDERDQQPLKQPPDRLTRCCAEQRYRDHEVLIDHVMNLKPKPEPAVRQDQIMLIWPMLKSDSRFEKGIDGRYDDGQIHTGDLVTGKEHQARNNRKTDEKKPRISQREPSRQPC